MLSPTLYQAIPVLTTIQRPDSTQLMVESRSVFVTRGTLTIPNDNFELYGNKNNKS